MIQLDSFKKFSFSKFFGSVGAWWRQRSSSVFLVLFLGVACLGIFSWYRSLYAFHWSSSEEQEYRLSKDKQVKFRQEQFDAALDALAARAAEHEKTGGNTRDVFFGP